jgi:hypothetical protein
MWNMRCVDARDVHYERQKLQKVVKVSLIRGRVEKVGIVLSLLLENIDSAIFLF